MAGDISAGPDYVARVLANHYDEAGAAPGEQPKSALELLSEDLAKARAEAHRRVIRTGKAVKTTFTITITDTVSFARSGDVTRLDTEVAPRRDQDDEGSGHQGARRLGRRGG